jgi:chemotaxis protein histidine kinase CheA
MVAARGASREFRMSRDAQILATEDNPITEPYEVLQAPRTLKAKARVLSGAEAARFNPIGEAEDALEKLSVNFQKWLDDQVAVLREAHDDGVAAGFSEDAMHALFRAAHDLRGQAATLGYPLAGEVAGSLCHLFDHIPAGGHVPRDLVRLHVDAVRAIVAEKASEENHATGRSLVDSLRAITDLVVDRISRNAA